MSTEGIWDYPGDPVVTRVFLLKNGSLVVLDQYGEEMPEHQGPVEEKYREVNELLPSHLWLREPFEPLTQGGKLARKGFDVRPDPDPS